MAVMNLTTGGLFEREMFEPAQCRERLAATGFARLAISIRCLPAVRPVAIAVRRHEALIAATEGAVIDAARDGDVLAVQIDGIDEDGSTWSVQATGAARLAHLNECAEELGDDNAVVRQVNGGATLVAIPLTILHGERVRWQFPRH